MGKFGEIPVWVDTTEHLPNAEDYDGPAQWEMKVGYLQIYMIRPLGMDPQNPLSQEWYLHCPGLNLFWTRVGSIPEQAKLTALGLVINRLDDMKSDFMSILNQQF